jgi:hypothetical protein
MTDSSSLGDDSASSGVGVAMPTPTVSPDEVAPIVVSLPPSAIAAATTATPGDFGVDPAASAVATASVKLNNEVSESSQSVATPTPTPTPPPPSSTLSVAEVAASPSPLVSSPAATTTLPTPNTSSSSTVDEAPSSTPNNIGMMSTIPVAIDATTTSSSSSPVLDDSTPLDPTMFVEADLVQLQSNTSQQSISTASSSAQSQSTPIASSTPVNPTIDVITVPRPPTSAPNNMGNNNNGVMDAIMSHAHHHHHHHQQANQALFDASLLQSSMVMNGMNMNMNMNMAAAAAAAGMMLPLPLSMSMPMMMPMTMPLLMSSTMSSTPSSGVGSDGHMASMISTADMFQQNLANLAAVQHAQHMAHVAAAATAAGINVHEASNMNMSMDLSLAMLMDPSAMAAAMAGLPALSAVPTISNNNNYTSIASPRHGGIGSPARPLGGGLGLAIPPPLTLSTNDNTSSTTRTPTSASSRRTPRATASTPKNNNTGSPSFKPKSPLLPSSKSSHRSSSRHGHAQQQSNKQSNSVRSSPVLSSTSRHSHAHSHSHSHSHGSGSSTPRTPTNGPISSPTVGTGPNNRMTRGALKDATGAAHPLSSLVAANAIPRTPYHNSMIMATPSTQNDPTVLRSLPTVPVRRTRRGAAAALANRNDDISGELKRRKRPLLKLKRPDIKPERLLQLQR